jgi:hypothetical protein
MKVLIEYKGPNALFSFVVVYQGRTLLLRVFYVYPAHLVFLSLCLMHNRGPFIRVVPFERYKFIKEILIGTLVHKISDDKSILFLSRGG